MTKEQELEELTDVLATLGNTSVGISNEHRARIKDLLVKVMCNEIETATGVGSRKRAIGPGNA